MSADPKSERKGVSVTASTGIEVFPDATGFLFHDEQGSVLTVQEAADVVGIFAPGCWEAVRFTDAGSTS